MAFQQVILRYLKCRHKCKTAQKLLLALCDFKPKWLFNFYPHFAKKLNNRLWNSNIAVQHVSILLWHSFCPYGKKIKAPCFCLCRNNIYFQLLSKPGPYPMVHLPPGCIFTIHPPNPSLDGDGDGGAEPSVGRAIERDETAHCYRDHFLGQVRHACTCFLLYCVSQR